MQNVQVLYEYSMRRKYFNVQKIKKKKIEEKWTFGTPTYHTQTLES